MAKFAKGQSGNPGGRPKTIALLRELAQAETEANIRTLVTIRDNKKSPHAARVAAVRELFDRGYGKATQAISGPDDGAIEVHQSETELARVIAFILAREANRAT